MYQTETKRQDWKCQVWQCHCTFSLSIISVKPSPEVRHQRLFGKHQISSNFLLLMNLFWQTADPQPSLYNQVVCHLCCHSQCKACSLRGPTAICRRSKHQIPLGIQHYLPNYHLNLFSWSQEKGFLSANYNSLVPVNGQGPNHLTEHLDPLFCVPQEAK